MRPSGPGNVLLAFSLAVIASSQLIAQTEASIPINFAVWAGYEGNHPLKSGSPWRLQSEATAKRNEGILETQAYLLEAGLGYDLTRGLQASGGYAIQYNFPYDSASQPYKWAEHRVWQEARIHSGRGGGTEFKQRIRTEEKWAARKSAPDYDKVTSYNFEVTLRYQFGVEFPLQGNAYSKFNNEIHLRIVPSDEKRFDQNRLFGGIGFTIDREKANRVEVGYMLQTVRNSSEAEPGRKRVNHTIRITFISASPLNFK
jgi:hypothetical protein